MFFLNYHLKIFLTKLLFFVKKEIKKKVIVYNKAFQYLCYKKAFLYENLKKKKNSDVKKKLKKAPKKILKNSPK